MENTKYFIGEDSYTDIDKLIEWLKEQKKAGNTTIHTQVY